MKKMALYYECPHCSAKSRFEKHNLPTYPDDLDKNEIYEVECPECKMSDVATLQDVKNALANPKAATPKTPKAKWKFYWEK
jgi:endogenous inhibitor of DNA gyrase (YacG/DUF329 family)